MRPQTVRILTIVVMVQMLVLALVLWTRRDTGSALEAFEGSDGYLVVTMLDTEVGPGPYFAATEREVIGATAGPVERRTDTTFGEFGAYGDSLGSTCETDTLVRFLTDVNPERGTSWAGAHGIEPASIAGFVEQLRLSVVPDYVLVTGHRFGSAGDDVAEQVVLAPGTAVLVDADDNPRVRCLSGAPITAAHSTDADATATEGG